MSESTDPTKATRDEAALLEFARKRFRFSADYEAELRANMLEDKKFLCVEQWPEGIRRQREAEGRPCLTIDHLTPQVKQVTNHQRAMRPAITVNPVAGGADPKTAEVIQGLVRHIETQSDADDAYDQAGRDEAEIGRGWIRVLTEYCDDESFDQEIKIARIRNTFSVYPDPTCQKRDYSDGLFLFVVEDLLFEEFKARYPRATVASLEEFSSIGDDQKYWIQGDSVRVAEYWHVEIERAELKAADGTTRQVKRRKVVCDKISALEVLEHYAWPGKYIPIVPVLGEENDIEGKVDLRGMVRRAKDPQRMLNFWKSATTETIALAPKSPFVAAEGQTEPYAKQWKSANRRNPPVLIYKPTTIAGTVLPPPQRQTAEPPIQALVLSTQAAENDLRTVTAFADLNERETREQSGRAILARQQQGEHGNSDLLDGLSRGVRHVGRIVVDLLPHIYDVPRVMRINGLDMQPKTVMVHAGTPPDPNALPEGVEGVFDLGVGRYDVTVTTGPSFQTARQQFVEQLTPVFQAQPQLFQVIGDLFFDSMDIPNARAIADRLKKLLPPQLQDQGAQDPAAAQAQMQQMGQQMQLMAQQLQQAQQMIQGKQLELEAQKEIEAAKIQSQQAIKQAELDSKEKIAAIQAQVDSQKALIDGQIAQMKIDAENSRAAIAANRAEQAQQSEHEHAADMAERAAAHAALEPKAA